MQLETTVQISAAADKVWSVMEEVERWPQWTASMKTVQRLQANGARFGLGSEARVKQPKMAAMVWRVTQFKPGQGFIWEARSPGARVVAEHWITPESSAQCDVLLKVEITGLLEPVLRPWLKALTRRNLNLEAEGLKRRCEAA